MANHDSMYKTPISYPGYEPLRNRSQKCVQVTSNRQYPGCAQPITNKMESMRPSAV